MFEEFTKKELEDIVAISIMKLAPKEERQIIAQNYAQKYGGFLEKNTKRVRQLIEEGQEHGRQRNGSCMA